MDSSTISAVVGELTRDERTVLDTGIAVVPAFSTHKWRYDPSRASTAYTGCAFRLHAPAASRVAMLEERLAWARGRCLRNDFFRPPPQGERREYNKLYRVDELPALMAEVGLGQATRKVMVIGMLTQPEEGLWCLEDAERSVALYLGEPGGAAIGRSPGFFTDTCIVLVHGVYEPEFYGEGAPSARGASGAVSRSTALTEGRLPGALRVAELIHPPQEPREATLHQMNAKDTFRAILTPKDYERVAAIEAEAGREKMLAVLSDCHCDSPVALGDLRRMLQGFSASGSIPALFVIMGNFTARPFGASLGSGGRGSAGSSSASASSASASSASTSPSSVFSQAMQALSALLLEFPDVCAATHFVLVPGPGDPGSAPVLPRPPLPTALCAPHLCAPDGSPRPGLPFLTLATNPCRLRFYTKEIVVFRGEPSVRLSRASMLPPYPPPQAPWGGEAAAAAAAAAAEGEEGEEAPLTRPTSFHVAHTLVTQGHLLPLSLHSQPIYWEFDHALRLNPTPHAIIIGEDAKFWSEGNVNGALVFNPGSFAGDRSFAVYRPVEAAVEESSVLVEEGEEEEA